MDRDRNLLFGVLAVQLKRVAPAQLVEAAALWLADPTIPLADRLVQLGAISREDRDFLDAIVENAVGMHGDDPGRAYEALQGAEEWRHVVNAAPPSESALKVSTMLDLPVGVRHVEIDDTAAVEESPGRYSRTSEYARGGMGRIMLVHDQFLDRDIALKELLPFADVGDQRSTVGRESPVRASAEIVGRFLREARVTGQLEHPSIVPVYELGRRPDGSLYYTMKLVRGRTLSRAIRETTGFEERLRLIGHVVDLCHAIAYAHSRNVVHRDIKPSNVMVGSFGETVVIDWGLAKIIGADDVEAEQIRESWSRAWSEDAVPETDAGAALGTPHYMSPEQADGRVEDIDQRSDVYGLGVVLYEVLTGEVPFHGGSTHEILQNVMRGEARPIHEVEPRVPPELAAICARAMAHRPDDRYASAHEFADELVRFQTGALVRSHRYTPRELLRHYYRKQRAVWNTAALATMALILVAAISYIDVVRARDAEHAQRLRAEHDGYLAQIRLAGLHTDALRFDAARATLEETKPELRNWEWGYLSAQAHQELATLTHDDSVFDAKFSPNGHTIVTVAADRSVGLWDADTYEERHRWTFPGTWVRQAGYSPDSRYVAIALVDGTVRVVDTVSGGEVARIDAHAAPVNYAAFSPDGNHLASAASDGRVIVWDWRSGTSLHDLRGHNDEVKFAEFAHDGAHVISWSQDNEVRLWDLHQNATVAILEGYRVHEDDTGQGFVYISGGEAITYDIITGNEVFRTPADSGPLNNARPGNGDTVVTAASTGVARVWRRGTTAPLATVNPGEPVKDAFLSDDGTRLVTQVGRGRLDVWDVPTQRKLFEIAGHGSTLTTAAFSPDGSKLITASTDHTARIWDATRARSHSTITHHRAGPVAVAVSHDGSIYATAGADHTIRIIDAQRGIERYRVACQSLAVDRAVAFAAEKSWIVATVEETIPMVFDAESGDLVARYVGHDAWVTDLACSPTTNDVVSGDWSGEIHLWNADSGESRVAWAGHDGIIRACSFSPSGSRLATVSQDGTAKIWDTEDGALVQTLEHGVDITAVAFSPDGKTLATGAADRRIRVWNVASGALLSTDDTHGHMVADVAFTHDGTRLLSGSWDSTVLVSEPATGDAFISARMSTDIIDAVALLPDTPDLIVADRSGAVRRWHVPDGRQETHTSSRAVASEASEPTPVYVVTTAGLLQSSLKRLREVFDTQSASHPPIVAGAAADAVARLCMLPGDTIVAVNGAAVPDAAAVGDAIDAWRTGGTTPTFTIQRDRQTLTYTFHLHEPLVVQDAIVLTSGEALALLHGARQVLTEGIEAVLQLNHEYAASIGEPLADHDGLAGLWLIPMESVEGRNAYAKVGAHQGDHITHVNGQPITSREQLLTHIDDAIKALEQGGTGNLVVDIERGSLRLFQRTITIR